MNSALFLRQLVEEGFPAPVVVTREPGAMGTHSHPFEAKALVVAGEITIRIGNDERLYAAGDVFHIPANVEHAERYGHDGVQYLAGRKSL